MSLTRRILFGAAASWFSRGVTIVLGLVLLPVLFRALPQEELGIWLLLGQSWATLGVFDLGFGVTLTRQIAFAKGKSGSTAAAPLNEASLAEIADILTTGRRIYRSLAMLSFVIAFGLGAMYVRSLNLEQLPVVSVWTAWGMLCLSFAINTWTTPWGCLLQGVGYVGWDALLISFVNVLTLVGQIVAALLGGGVIALAAVAMGGALMQRFVLLGFAKNKRPELFRLRGSWNNSQFRKMLPLAIKAWMTALGLIMVLNTDHLFVARLDGAASLPMYRAAYLIFLNINMLAVTVAGASSVFITHLWQEGEIVEIQRIVIRNCRLGLYSMAVAGGCLLGLGEVFFDFWLGADNFVGQTVIVVFFVLLLLEAQAFIIATASRATEDEAFVLWAIGAGLLKLLLSWQLGGMFGVAGVAVSTLIAQLTTNHWFMVHRGLRRLQINMAQYLCRVFVPTCGLVLASYGLAATLAQFSQQWPGWLVVFSAIAGTAVILCLALWRGVLDNSHRHWMIRRFSLF